MKKVYLISYFEGSRYKGTIYIACATRDIAKGYAHACDNGCYTFSIVEVDYLQ